MGDDGIYAKDAQVSLTVEVVTGWTDYITAIDMMAQQLKAAGIEWVRLFGRDAGGTVT